MHEQIATRGWFTTTEGHMDRNKFRAAIHAIQAYLLENTDLHLHMDNTVFCHHLRKLGGKVRR